MMADVQGSTDTATLNLWLQDTVGVVTGALCQLSQCGL